MAMVWEKVEGNLKKMQNVDFLPFLGINKIIFRSTRQKGLQIILPSDC